MVTVFGMGTLATHTCGTECHHHAHHERHIGHRHVGTYNECTEKDGIFCGLRNLHRWTDGRMEVDGDGLRRSTLIHLHTGRRDTCGRMYVENMDKKPGFLP